MPQLIDLAQNRKLVIHENGCRYAVTVARISESAWLEIFFDAIAFSLGKGSHASPAESLNATRMAGIQLFEGAAMACEGYPHLQGVQDWPTKIPPVHKLAFGDALLRVIVLNDNRPPRFLADQTCVVRIQSLWSASTSGTMYLYRDLSHRFKSPSAQQRRQISNAYAGLRQLSGFSRRGQSVSLAPLQQFPARELISLYDDLIASVEGYSVAGEPLGNTRSEITLHMDAFHKVMAMRPVFTWNLAQIKETRVM